VIFPLDERLFRAIFANGSHGLVYRLALVFTCLGSGWTMLAIAPLAFRPKTRRFAAWLVAVLVTTAILVYVTKATLGRDRPCLACADLARVIVASPTDPSFPSGHAAGSAAFAMFAVHALLDRVPRPRFAMTTAVACVILAACVGVSRVILGAHFPSDVVAGALLGSTVGGLAGRRYTRGARRL
jgi:undecaprenyl-diphosphatase